MGIRAWLRGRLVAGGPALRPARRAPQALQVPPPPSCPLGFLYTVQAGESLARIARRFGVRVEDVLRANPQVADPNLLFVGQVLCIPFVEPACPTGLVLEVQEGDTLFSIAREFGVTLEELIRLNPHIPDPNRILPGMRLCLPAGAATAASTRPEARTAAPTVRPGGAAGARPGAGSPPSLPRRP